MLWDPEILIMKQNLLSSKKSQHDGLERPGPKRPPFRSTANVPLRLPHPWSTHWKRIGGRGEWAGLPRASAGGNPRGKEQRAECGPECNLWHWTQMRMKNVNTRSEFFMKADNSPPKTHYHFGDHPLPGILAAVNYFWWGILLMECLNGKTPIEWCLSNDAWSSSFSKKKELKPRIYGYLGGG